MRWLSVVGFLVAVAPLVVTPGASFTLVTQRTLSGPRAAAGWVIAGTATGIYIHAILAAVGLSALVMRSSKAFEIVKLAGAVYLVGLGIWTIWQTRSKGTAVTKQQRMPWAGHHSYPQAVLVNVLNPKAASVYLTLAPQFLTQTQLRLGPMLLLATVHAAAMALWLSVWTILLLRGRRLVREDRLRTTVNRVGGAILVGLGVRTAVT